MDDSTLRRPRDAANGTTKPPEFGGKGWRAVGHRAGRAARCSGWSRGSPRTRRRDPAGSHRGRARQWSASSRARGGGAAGQLVAEELLPLAVLAADNRPESTGQPYHTRGSKACQTRECKAANSGASRTQGSDTESAVALGAAGSWPRRTVGLPVRPRGVRGTPRAGQAAGSTLAATRLAATRVVHTHGIMGRTGGPLPGPCRSASIAGGTTARARHGQRNLLWRAPARRTRPPPDTGGVAADLSRRCRGEAERGNRVDVLALQAQGRAARRQHGRVRTGPSSSISSGAASSTCSKLSTTSRSSRSRRYIFSLSMGGRSPPSAMASVGATSAGSHTAARETRAAPSAKAGASAWATASARRVLPTPPGLGG